MKKQRTREDTKLTHAKAMRIAMLIRMSAYAISTIVEKGSVILNGQDKTRKEALENIFQELMNKLKNAHIYIDIMRQPTLRERSIALFNVNQQGQPIVRKKTREIPKRRYLDNDHRCVTNLKLFVKI